MVETPSSDRVAFRILIKHHLRSSSTKTADGLNTLTVSAGKPHHRIPTGLQIRILLKVLQMGGVAELQVHGIRSRRLVCKDLVEALSNYKISYF